MKKALWLVSLIGCLAAPLAHAQFAKTEDAIKYRQSALTLMGNHMGRIGAVVKGEKPFNAAEVQASAAVIEFASRLPWEAFVPGSDQGQTKAKPDIWKEPARFKQASEKMQSEVAKLSAAAKTGDLAQIKTAFGAAGQSCKACHDDFRAK